jgi:hypothetical protein
MIQPEHNMFLKLPQFKINIRLSKNGRILKQYSEPGHSWTRNGWNWLFASVTDCAVVGGTSDFGAGFMTAKRNTGTVSASTGVAARGSTVCPTTSAGMVNSGATTTIGIVVGRGTTEFSVNDHALATLIAHGTSTNQLSHQAQVAPVTTYDPVTKTWTSLHSRSFTNSSANPVVVTEVGLHRGMSMFSTTSIYQHLVARDVLETSISVLPSTVLTVEYELSMDFSEID